MSNANVGQFRMVVTPRDAQGLDVTLYGITGAEAPLGQFYLACWQGSQIGSTKNIHAVMALRVDEESWTVPFNYLNMQEFDYTFALGVGGFTPNVDIDNPTNIPPDLWISQYFPVTATVPINWDNKPIESTPQNTVTVVYDGRSGIDYVNNTCNLPSGNIYQDQPQYVVVKNGGMDYTFPTTPVDRLMGYKHITDIQKTNLQLTKDLQIGSTYSIGYVMGQTDNALPDMNRLVGWVDFVA